MANGIFLNLTTYIPVMKPVYTCIFLLSPARRMHTLIGHRAEISSVQFNWDCALIVSGSMDKTCMVR